LVLALAAAIVVFRLADRIGVERGPDDRFVVARVLDGDTAELQGGDRVRLLGVDTPEKGEPLYREAQEYLADVAVGRTARLSFADRRRDNYGRLLSFLYVDTLLVNEAILAQGLGYLYLFEENHSAPEFQRLQKAQQTAIRSKRGVWAIKRSPESYYVAKVGSYRFHRPGCASVENLRPDNSQTFRTREEAGLAGLSPCRNCKP
jgi:micrococcal nuclease